MNILVDPFDARTSDQQYAEYYAGFIRNARARSADLPGYSLADGSPVYLRPPFTPLPSIGKSNFIFPSFRDDPAKAFSFSQRLGLINWHLLPSQTIRLVIRVVHAPMSGWTAPNTELISPQVDLWPPVKSIHRASAGSFRFLGQTLHPRSFRNVLADSRSQFRGKLPHRKN